MIALVERGRYGAFLPLVPANLHPDLERESVFLVGAVEDGTAVGAAVIEVGEIQMDLLSIAVAPQRRRQGIGSALLRRCVTLTQGLPVRSFSVASPKENQELESFFSSQGWLEAREVATSVEITLGELEKLPLFRGPVPGVVPLEAVPEQAYREYLQHTFPGDPTQCRREDLDQRISQVTLSHGQVAACALVAPVEGGVSLCWLHNRSADKLAPLFLLRAAFAAGRKLLPPETTVVFSVDTPLLLRISEKLIGDLGRRQQLNVWEISDFALTLFDEEEAAHPQQEEDGLA